MALTVKHRFTSPKAEQVDPTLVGPNEWNDFHIITGGALPFLVSSDFIFSTQSPGGILNIGANSLVLNPVPQGVVVGSTLYVSGGIGAAEAVPVTGLTGSTAIITCVNTHTGAWTIQSASSGIQEAINTLGAGGGLIYVPVGTWAVYTTISFSTGSYRIVGSGRGSTILSTTYTSGPIFSLTNPHSSVLEDFEIDGPSTGNNFAIAINTGWNNRIQRLKITNVANGISLTGTLLLNAFRDIEIDIPNGGSGTGVFINGGGGGEAGGTFDRVFIQGDGVTNGNKGFDIVQGVGAVIRDCYTNGVTKALYIHPGNGQTVGIIDLERAYFDGFTTATQNAGYGIHISPGAGSQLNTIRGIHTGILGFLAGLVIDGTAVTDVIFTDGLFNANQQDGILVTAATKNLSFIDCWVENNNVSNNPADGGASISNVTNLTIRGGVFAAGAYGGGANTQYFGIGIGNCTNVIIDSVVVAPNITNTITVGSSTGVVIENCIGYNPKGLSVITVGASPFTYTSGFSAETVYISAGTVSSVTRGGITLATNTVVGQSITIPLSPNSSIIVTYSVVPNMVRDTQ